MSCFRYVFYMLSLRDLRSRRLKLRLAHTEDEAGDFFENGEEHQHAQHLALAEGLGQLEALRNTDRKADKNQSIIDDGGEARHGADKDQRDAQIRKDAQPAVPDS